MEAYVLPACIEADGRVIGKNHTKLLAEVVWLYGIWDHFLFCFFSLLHVFL